MRTRRTCGSGCASAGTGMQVVAPFMYIAMLALLRSRRNGLRTRRRGADEATTWYTRWHIICV